jgi:hypothetical protein
VSYLLHKKIKKSPICINEGPFIETQGRSMETTCDVKFTVLRSEQVALFITLKAMSDCVMSIESGSESGSE